MIQLGKYAGADKSQLNISDVKLGIGEPINNFSNADKWYYRRYSGGRAYVYPEDFKGLTPTASGYYNDVGNNSNIFSGIGDNYRIWLRTYVIMENDYTWSASMYSDDEGTLTVNDVHIKEAASCTSTSFSVVLKKGINKIEFCVAEGTGGDLLRYSGTALKDLASEMYADLEVIKDQSLSAIMYNNINIFEMYNIPLSTSQNKTAGAGYGLWNFEWNGDYANSKIQTIKMNTNIGLHSGDEWLSLTINLEDGTSISKEYGNGSYNFTQNFTTNSGVPYSIKVEQYNVITTFDIPVKTTKIIFSTSTKYGTWRSEGFNNNLYVTGFSKA